MINKDKRDNWVYKIGVIKGELYDRDDNDNKLK